MGINHAIKILSPGRFNCLRWVASPKLADEFIDCGAITAEATELTMKHYPVCSTCMFAAENVRTLHTINLINQGDTNESSNDICGTA